MPGPSQRRNRNLLIVLIGILLFVRMVDLHWHQPLPEQHADPAGAHLHSSYLADASTPHTTDHPSADVSIAGDEGFAHKLPLLPLLANALLFFFLLLLPHGSQPLPQATQAAPPRRPHTRLPPACGPPRLPN